MVVTIYARYFTSQTLANLFVSWDWNQLDFVVSSPYAIANKVVVMVETNAADKLAGGS